MKVINIISDTNLGGAGRCLINYVDNYNRDDIDLEVFIPTNSVLKQELINRNIAFTEVDYIADKSFNKKAVFLLRKLFQEKKPDLIHSHATMSARIAGRLYGKCKIVYTRHSVFDQPEKLKKFPKKTIYGLIDNLTCDKIIAVSPAAKDNITEIGSNQKKIEIIFNGVDKVIRLSDEEKQDIKNKYFINESDFVVSIIARLEEVKGHRFVLKTCEELLEKAPNIKIIIAGNGTLEEEIRCIVKEKKLINTIVTGFVSDIYKIENITDLQINASYGTEATSLSLLEGFSLGIPAVVSDFGGNPYVVKDDYNGFLFQKNNCSQLTNRILQIYENKDLYNKLSKGAIKDYENRFTSKVMADNISNLYKKVVEVNNGK